MENKKKMIMTYGFVVLCVVLSKGLGFAREMCLAHFYGTSQMAAAFSTASKIPLVFFDITLGSGVSAAFIPVFNKLITKEGKKAAFSFANLFITTAGMFAAMVTLLLAFFPQVAVKFMASGLSLEGSALCAELLRLMSPIIFIAVFCYSLVGILQSMGEFNRPAIMSTLSNLALILYFLFFNQTFGIYGLAVALVVGWILQVAILLRPLYGFSFRFACRFSFGDSALKETLALALPVLISSWAQPINTVLSTNIASYLDGGSGAAIMVINYSYQLYFMLAGIFSYGFTNIFFPKLSRCYAEGKREEGEQLLYLMVSAVTLIVLPVLAFVAISAEDLVRVAYESGQFTSADTKVTGLALSIYIFGMLGFSWQEILNKFFYSAHDSKTPMKISFGVIGINVLLSLLLAPLFGAAGIAIASTLSVSMQGILLYAFARGGKHLTGKNPYQKDLYKSIAGSLLFAMMVFGLGALLPECSARLLSLVRLGVVFGGGLLVYLLALWIMKATLFMELIGGLRRRKE